MFADIQAEVVTAVSEIIADNSVSITLIRGGAAQAAQTVRVERSGGMNTKIDNANVEETRGTIIILGTTTLDIRKNDEFVLAGSKYRVNMVRNNQTAMVQAEAHIIQ